MAVRSVRAQHYKTNEQHPVPAQVLYCEDHRQPEKGRYLLAADQLSDAKRQPYVHDCTVTTTFRRRRYAFRIFYKRHKHLPLNQAVHTVANVAMEGDVIVVAYGKRVGLRNMRSRLEMRAAQDAVQKY